MKSLNLSKFVQRCITLLSATNFILLPTHTYAGAINNNPSKALIQRTSTKVIKAKEHIPNRYIVVFKDSSVGPSSIYSTGNIKADVEDLANTLTDRHGGYRGKTWHNTIKGMTAQLSPLQAEELANDPDVAYVEEDGVSHTNTIQTPATWGLDRIDQPSLPLNNTYNYTGTGAGVTAYIIDTGIHITHQEFAGRALWGTNTVDTINDDCNGHGTHVAGTVGGATYGVAKGVQLVAVKVLDCTGSGTNSGVIAGIDWVTAQKTPNSVANMSLGGGFSAAINDAVARSVAAGVTYAVAAGNNAADACTFSPASEPSAITVGATDSLDQRPTYSNYGTCVDIFAPGSIITSAWYTSDTATNTISGTSMASPHVAGVAALYIAANPGSTPAQVSGALISNSRKNIIPSPGVGSPNRLLSTNLAPPDFIAPTGVSLSIPANAANLTGTVALTATATDNVGISKVEFYANSTLIGTSTSAVGGIFTLSLNTVTLVNGSYNLTVTAYDAANNSTSTNLIPVVVKINNLASACAPISQQIIDPTFELLSPAWVVNTTGIVSNLGAGVAYNGLYGAWLGGYGVVHTDDLYQDVTIPAYACAATLSFMMKIVTTEKASAKAVDTMTVSVLNSTGTVLAKLATYSNVNSSAGYVLKTFVLSAYKGQKIRLKFNAVENGSLKTSFYVDNVTVN